MQDEKYYGYGSGSGRKRKFSKITRGNNLNSRMRKLESKVNSNQDWRKKIVTVPETVIDTAAHYYYMSAIAQGDAQGERTGNQINVGSILIRLLCKNSSGAAVNSHALFRVVLLQVKSNKQGTPTNVFDSTSTLSPLNITGGSDIKVFMDKMIDLDYANRSYSEKIFILGKRMVDNGLIKYSGGTIANTDSSNNALHLYVTSDVLSGNNPPSITVNCKISYTG